MSRTIDSIGKHRKSGLNSARLGLALSAILVLSGHLAHAQVNQLHFAFTDAPGTTNTPSDTVMDPGALSVTLGMTKPLTTTTSGPGDLHGAVGSGVSGAITGNRAMDFTPNLVPLQGTTEPADGVTGASGNSADVAFLGNSATLATLGNSGTINAFVATIWIKIAYSMGTGNILPRVWIINGGSAGTDTGAANSIGLKFQGAGEVYFQLNADTFTADGLLSSGVFPTNQWLFFATVYDGTTATIYYGTDTSVTRKLGNSGTPTHGNSVALGSTACLTIGNRHTSTTSNTRGFNGWINDFRFYNGAPSNALAFVENIRIAGLGGPPSVTGMSPDGSMLQSATNTFTFTASSPAGSWGPSTNITNITMFLNGHDVSSQLQIATNGTPGTATNLTVSYTGLPQNMPANVVAITVQDAKGLIGTGSATFDTFSPTNFVWEAEEFDYYDSNSGLSGQFINNPDYTDVSAPPDANSYFGLDSTELIDTHKGTGNGGVNASDYRAGAADPTKTQTPATAGEALRLKFINNPDTNAVDHMIANTSNPDWQNYTKVFPAGLYNVYGRFSGGAGTVPVTLSLVTSGQGTSSQTTSNLGTFNFTAGAFSYAPLRDGFGNLATVNLAGTNTVRATWGSGGSANFYMLVPANTNLPSITGVYPDGLVLFEPTNKLVFTASSAVTTISTNSIRLSLNGTDVSSNLVFTGGPSTWNVAYTGLSINAAYTAVINVTDGNGGAASSTIKIDTYNPVLQVEGEDFDFDPNQSPISNGTGLRYIDNPVPTTNAQANSYFGQIGAELIDENGNNNGNSLNTLPGYNTDNYRVNDRVMTSLLLTDSHRQQFVTAGANDYNLGFMGNGFWQEYTRTWPTGTFNIYGRVASGNGGTVHIRMDKILAGWGTVSQVVSQMGTFNCPANGGYGNYLYVPMLDRFGNYANVTLGGTNTIRTTVDNPININFYMLTAARTDLPRIDNVYPDGSVLMQPTNKLSFIASSPTYGINVTNIHVTLNGVNISSSLVFSGSSTSWNVSYTGLAPSTNYTAVITVTDQRGSNATTTVTFDTFNAANFTWEAEDWDFDPNSSPQPNGSGLRYIDNPAPTSGPATNSYFGQISELGIDVDPIYATIHPGTHTYRNSDYISTEVTTDAPRQKYLNAQLLNIDPGIADYDIAFWTNNSFINWTRTFPSGNFHVYARLAGGNGAFNLPLYTVTSGWGTTTQTTQYQGTFKGTGTSFTAWQYVPLINTNSGQLVTLTLGGTNTFQMIADGNENANFFMLVPAPAAAVSLTATTSGGNILVAFPTQSGFTYTISYKNNLRDANWTVLTSVIGDGTVKTVSDPATLSSRYYRLSIQ